MRVVVVVIVPAIADEDLQMGAEGGVRFVS